MEIGAEISQKIRSAIKSKLMEVGAYVDDELPDYIMVMVANKKSQEQMTEDLSLFLGSNTEAFTAWLHNLLRKLQEITIDKITADVTETPEPTNTELKRTDSKEQKIKATPTATKATPTTVPPPKADSPPPTAKGKKVTAAPVTAEAVKATEPVKAKSLPTVEKAAKPTPRRKSKTSEQSSLPEEPEVKVSLEHDEFEAEPEPKPVSSRHRKSESSSMHKSKEHSSSSKAHEKRSSAKVSLKRPAARSDQDKEGASKPRLLSSAVGAVIHHNVESSDEEPPTVASVVKVTERKSSIRPDLQPNKSLLLKAMSEAQKSIEAASRKLSSRQHAAPYDKSERPSVKKRLGTQIKQPITSRLGLLTARRPTSEESDNEGRESDDDRKEEAPALPKGRVVELYTKSKREELKRQKEASVSEEEEKEPKVAPPKKKKLVRKPPTDEDEQESEDGRDDEEVQEERVSKKVLKSDVRRVEHTDKPSVARVGRVMSKALASRLGVRGSVGKLAPSKTGIFERVSIRATESSPLQDAVPQDEIHLPAPEDGEEVENILDSIISVEEDLDLMPLEENVDKKIKKPTLASSTSSPKFVVTLDGYNLSPTAMNYEEEEEDSGPVYQRGVEKRTLSSGKTVGLVLPQRPSIEPIAPVTIDLEDDMDEGDVDPPPTPASTVNMSDPEKPVAAVPKLLERCAFWPACKNAANCPYVHPNTPCRNFPACIFGDKCIYIHPNCRYDTFCTRPGCAFTHSAGHTGAAQGAAPPFSKQKNPSEVVCIYYPKCTNMQCPYKHPKPCRFGIGCTMKATCHFTHPELPSKDKFVWRPPAATAGPTEQHPMKS